jgi:hypothetical protein
MKFPQDKLSGVEPISFTLQTGFFGFASLQQNGQLILMNAKEFG